MSSNRSKARKHADTAQLARLCVIRSESEMVILSSARTTIVAARIAGDYNVELDEALPVFELTEADRAAAVGTDDWGEAVRRIGFGLVAISFLNWTEETVHASLRATFPTIARANPKPK